MSGIYVALHIIGYADAHSIADDDDDGDDYVILWVFFLYTFTVLDDYLMIPFSADADVHCLCSIRVCVWVYVFVSSSVRVSERTCSQFADNYDEHFKGGK